MTPLQWRHNDHDSVSNHQPCDWLLNGLFKRRSKKTSKLRVTGLCAGNSPGTGEFPAQRASNAENVSIWWRHHAVAASNPVLYIFAFCYTTQTDARIMPFCFVKIKINGRQAYIYIHTFPDISWTSCPLHHLCKVTGDGPSLTSVQVHIVK